MRTVNPLGDFQTAVTLLEHEPFAACDLLFRGSLKPAAGTGEDCSMK
jgi:hypothetical protein